MLFRSDKNIESCMLQFSPNWEEDYVGGYKSGSDLIFYTNNKVVGTYRVRVLGRRWISSLSNDITPIAWEEYYSSEFTLTITSNGNGGNDGGGNEESGSEYNPLNLMYPMPQSHGAIPFGAPGDWKYNSRWENKDKPSGWKAFVGWAQVYKVDGTPWTSNTGVEMKDYEVYGWKNGQWNQVTKIATPTGNFYATDFTDDANSSFPNSLKPNDDRTAAQIILTEDMTLSTSQGIKYVCYHPFTSQMNYDSSFEYIFTCVKMRKIKWNASGIDDMSTSRYCASCGGDWWREPGLTWAPDWSNNKGITQQKIMEVTNDWNRFSMTTVPENWTNGFPE